MKTRRVNVALVLGSEEANRAVWDSETIARLYFTHFTLNNQNGPYPHVTLYSFERKEFEDAPGGETKLRQEVVKLRLYGGGINCGVSGVTSRRGYIVVDLDQPEKLMEFQARVINALRHFAKPVECTEEEIRKHGYTQTHIDNLRKYGFPDIGEEYKPYITLSCLQHGTSAAAAIELVEENWSEVAPFHLPALALFRAGDHGTCKEAVDVLNLSDNNF